MERVEIVLKNIKNVYVEEVFYNCVLFDIKDMISSHFYDKKKNKDISYQEVERLNNYFLVPGTCSLYLKEATIGINLKNVFILIAFDEKNGDITINFEEDQFENFNIQELVDKLQTLIIFLQKIIKDDKVKEIILGYEPVDDADMKILAIGQKHIEVLNENVFKSSFANAIYTAAKDMNALINYLPDL